jgi:Zn-dependent protease
MGLPPSLGAVQLQESDLSPAELVGVAGASGTLFHVTTHVAVFTTTPVTLSETAQYTLVDPETVTLLYVILVVLFVCPVKVTEVPDCVHRYE